MRFFLIVFVAIVSISSLQAQGMEEMWDKNTTGKEHPNLQWFKDAKFGLFIHWGLYSQLAGTWKGKNYYGSGEWIMNQAKIPVKEYEQVAQNFNPVQFDAEQWAQLAKDAGVKYIVITAKHHDGFAMYDSKASDFNIVKSSAYKKDPLKALSIAAAKRNIQFGFYYSQFQDWHDPNGGKNTWDYIEAKKDYQKYYREKAVPQLKELLTGYGPLGIVWFDTPGGMTKEQTQDFVNELRLLQPKSLFSSRVGQGLGDYKDFGDSEVPSVPIKGAWESIYTHNDSWGYIEHDMNFKSSAEIIHLLANVASKGGNLMLNVGPDGKGNIPYYSVKYLQQTGKWLAANGESIYGTTFGFIPAQPWGVTTSKPGKLFLHVLNTPANGKLLVPGFSNKVNKVYTLVSKKAQAFTQKGSDLLINLQSTAVQDVNTVVVVEYAGNQPEYNNNAPVTVSFQFLSNNIDAVFGKTAGNAKERSLTYSHYYGDWKHTNCITGMQSPADSVSFEFRVTDAGDYKVMLEYACPQESAKQEGILVLNGKEFLFRTLRTSEFEKSAPLMFIKHTILTTRISKPGIHTITIRPLKQGKELFKLKSVILEPVQ